MKKNRLRVYCGTCRRYLLDLEETDYGFQVRAQQHVKITPLFEQDEARLMVGCSCKGYIPKDWKHPTPPASRFRSYLMTFRALAAAWDQHETEGVNKLLLGDAVAASRLRERPPAASLAH